MSATGTGSVGLCGEVEEQLAEVLDGTARTALYEHIAGCDACRDLRHDAARAAEVAAAAGADFRPADGFAEALLRRLEAARPSEGATSGAVLKVAAEEQHGAAGARSSVIEERSSVIDGRSETAERRSFGSGARSDTPEQRSDTPERRSFGSGARSDTPERRSDIAEGRSDIAEGRSDIAEGRSDIAEGRSDIAEGRSDIAEGRSDTPERRSDTAEKRSGAAEARTGGPRSTIPERTAPAPRRARGPAFGRRSAFAAVALAAAAAVTAGVALRRGGETTPSVAVAAGAPWSGKVASVSRASADKSGGLEACDAAGACAPLAAGAALPEGATLRTDARTRAHLALADGSALAVDRGSRVWIAGDGRAARVDEGAVVLDITPIPGAPPARIKVPHGEIEVLGTKLAITAGAARASIEVARGAVRVTGERGEPVEVRAGEEATLAKGAAPEVASATSLADTLEWSDRSAEEADAPALRGLGELRARKPGATQEKERAVRLARHAVKVRIVDVVARTEIDETFANDTDEELEGIFRFPLPPGAQIERLALEVDGKLVEGAFVDRDRGAAIWRGVLQNAAPKAPKPREEIIWVPGPWRDPALLEWQRGGRFELRIFPIPKRGSRRVVLTYTQLVEQAGGVRRFTYPLAHDQSGTTNIGDFSLDVQVLGHDREFGVATRGYELAAAPADGAADRRTLEARGFTPAGDLTVEYALPDRERPVSAWAYRMPPAPAPAAALSTATAPPAWRGAAGAASAAGTAKRDGAEHEASLAAAQAIASDTSPYVAIAIRPRLPRWHEATSRRHAIVVDSSRSMVGERFARATRLASSIVREMDRRDEVVVLACDTLCRSLGEGGQGGAARPMAPGAASAGEVERFLGGVEPDGGSDLAAAVIAARAAAGPLDGKELRIIYLGDGTPSVGPTRPAHIEAAVRGAIPADGAAVIAVALGSDADTTSLRALARGGGGVMVPYVPGQKVASAAQSILGAAYGLALRDPELELPPGLTQVTPARLDPIRAGGEALVVARMSSGADVTGAIRLRGRVSGERFEQTYPVDIVATTGAGNAFVPRLYAAAKIAELEETGGDAQKPAIIELSRRFSVASRFTSLLVLESEAMFKAFGLARDGIASAFTGEEQAERVSASAEGEEPGDAADEGAEEKGDGLGARLGLSGSGRGGGGSSWPEASAAPAAKAESRTSAGARPASPAKPQRQFEESFDPRSGPLDADMPAPPPAPTAAAPAEPKPALPQDDRARRSPDDGRRVAAQDWWEPRPRRMIPMRRVFDRKVSFDATNTLAPESAAKTAAAEAALAAAPDSRDRTAGLYALYATTGRLGEAQELTARWSGRDALDPDALIARADLAARQGERDRAARILGGLADVRPGDRAAQTRLAELWDAAGRPAFACQHRVALADLAPADAKLVAAAIRCAGEGGMSELASQLRLDVSSAIRAEVDRRLAQPDAAPSAGLPGDVQLSAEWTGGADLDLSLIDAQGRRLSWMGSTLASVGVRSRDATSPRSESLALRSLPKGSYVVEIARASAVDGAGASTTGAGAGALGPVRGELTLRLAGETRKVPFTLEGARLELGTVRVFFTSRLVPVDLSPMSVPF
ncbi:VIT domain-containing protein [Sorangium sp. So ce1000]|uniref:VIT domain-containing protein n=1 Tax=Sorangium sp. So ce1000 TaxID=3133325 RepID=UPI003F628977